MEGELLTIGQLAARAGLRTSALRYYEQEGLLAPAARVGGRRRYQPEAIEQLTVIGFCRELGFSLADIRRLLEQPEVCPSAAAGGRWWTRSWPSWRPRRPAETMRAILAASRDCDCIDVAECASKCEAVAASGARQPPFREPFGSSGGG